MTSPWKCQANVSDILPLLAVYEIVVKKTRNHALDHVADMCERLAREHNVHAKRHVRR
jgi:hypothetical protein